jgi:3-oxoacyl-[acyl-carrier protein] reductase
LKRLEDKVVVVTGGGQGLGRAYSTVIAGEGARVAVADIDLEKAQDAVQGVLKNGGRATAVKMDVSNEESVKGGFSTIVGSFGGIDVLVNNAALTPPRIPFDEITIEQWDMMMNVNLKGTWLTTKNVLPFLKARGKGKIINITSTLAIKGGPYEAHYSASKAGVLNLTKTFAQELGQYNITVNAIAPGLTVTETTKKFYGQEIFEASASRRSIKRIEYPDDVVGTMVFLVSDESDFITGQTIIVSGGDYFI